MSAGAREERESEMASGEIEQNEGRQEERWRDDQISHVGHFIAVRKGLIYPPPRCPHGPKAKFQLCMDTTTPLLGPEHKRLYELKPEVGYCWLRVDAITHRGGQGLSLL